MFGRTYDSIFLKPTNKDGKNKIRVAVAVFLSITTSQNRGLACIKYPEKTSYGHIDDHFS